MSKFNIGDRVRAVDVIPAEAMKGTLGTVTSVTPNNYGDDILVKWDTDHLVKNRSYKDASVEHVSRRVRVTVEGTIEETTYNGLLDEFITVGHSEIYLNDLDPSQIEYLPEPVTLPTGKYAVIEIGNAHYVRNMKSWCGLGGLGRYTDATILDYAQKYPYRVIFEGED